MPGPSACCERRVFAEHAHCGGAAPLPARIRQPWLELFQRVHDPIFPIDGSVPSCSRQRGSGTLATFV